VPLYASRIAWDEGPVTVTADQAIAEHEADLRGEEPKRPSPELDEAEAFLRSWLEDGPRPAQKIEKAAADAGIKPRTLRRARERICYRTTARNSEGKIIGSNWALKPSHLATENPYVHLPGDGSHGATWLMTPSIWPSSSIHMTMKKGLKNLRKEPYGPV